MSSAFTRTRLSANGSSPRAQALLDGGRPAVARGAHRGENPRVIAAGGIAEELRHAGAEPSPQLPPRAGELDTQLRVRDHREIRVGKGVRVQLPAVGQQRVDLVFSETTLAEVAQFQVQHAGPAKPAQHRSRVAVLRQVAVVEGDDDRFAR